MAILPTSTEIGAPPSENYPFPRSQQVTSKDTLETTSDISSHESGTAVLPSVEKDSDSQHLGVSSHTGDLRPKLSSRQTSGTIIISRDQQDVVTPNGEYPPDDARAMSPRRNSVETEKLSEAARASVQE